MVRSGSGEQHPADTRYPEMSVAEIIEAQFGSQPSVPDKMACTVRNADAKQTAPADLGSCVCCRIILQLNGRGEQPRFPTITEKLKKQGPFPGQVRGDLEWTLI